MSASRPERSNQTRVSDWCLALCVIAGAAVYIYTALQLPSARAGADPVGPATFPYLIGAGLLGSGFLLISEIRRNKRNVEADEEPRSPTRYWRQLAVVAGWTALYFYAFEPIGYLAATAIYLWPMLAYFNRGHWITNTVIAISFSLVVYVIFVKLLYVSLPAGLLAF